MYLDYDVNKEQFICCPEILLYLSPEEIEEIENDLWWDSNLDWTDNEIIPIPIVISDDCPF